MVVGNGRQDYKHLYSNSIAYVSQRTIEVSLTKLLHSQDLLKHYGEEQGTGRYSNTHS